MSVQRRQRLLLADDHQLVLEVLSRFLSKQFEVAVALNGKAFIQNVVDFDPDLAILEISMPDMDGFRTAQEALRMRPSMPLLFLTRHEEAGYRRRAARVGAKAILSKRLSAEGLLQAITQVLNGKSLLPRRFPRHSKDQVPSLNALTPRQQEVLTLLVTGLTNREIAEKLNISSRTVELHRASTMQRLVLSSTAELTRFAIENGLA